MIWPSGWTRLPDRGPVPAYRMGNGGPDVVLVHGMEDRFDTWTEVATALAHVARVTAFDLPWRPRSDYEWFAGSSPGECLEHALDAHGLVGAFVLAHSFGAWATLEALGRGVDLAAVVLVAPLYCTADEAADPATVDAIRSALQGTVAEEIGLRMVDRPCSGSEVEAHIVAMTSEDALARALPAIVSCMRRSPTLRLPALTTRVRIVASRDDPSMSPRATAEIAVISPYLSVRAVPGEAHALHRTQPTLLLTEAAATFGLAVSVASSAPADASPPLPHREEHRLMSQEFLAGDPASITTHPRYEGANIRTWVGFKHFMFLVEEAVLQYFRDRGCGAQSLYHEYGLGLAIIDSSVQLPHALEIDDLVVCSVQAAPRQRGGPGAQLVAEIVLRQGTDETPALRGKVTVALVREQGRPAKPAPERLLPFVVDTVGEVGGESRSLALSEGQDVADVLLGQHEGGYVWSWRAPYYYCHFSDRLQHSAFTRALESVVDNFLHDRGLGIGRLLRERSWIPVVSRARVRLHASAHMEEVIHTVFRVNDILMNTTFTATMECWVRRGDELILVASGTIMHGYVVSRGENAGDVAVLDPTTQAGLLGVAA